MLKVVIVLWTFAIVHWRNVAINSLHIHPVVQRRVLLSSSKQRMIGVKYHSKMLSSLHASSSEEEETESAEEKNRKKMKLVRTLQEVYYRSETNQFVAPKLDATTGILSQLPLWRVSWTELPGRSNVWNIHDPVYTHMFETILRQTPKPWYVGHLYKNPHPESSASRLVDDINHPWKSWQDMDLDEGQKKSNQENRRHTVVGTLMMVVDFRRIHDGRLCLLVHATERFLVHNVTQTLPYAVADVQILPDFDEYYCNLNLSGDSNYAVVDTLEQEAAVRHRAIAVVQSFRYHAYEFKDSSLPLSRDQDYFSAQEVYGSWLKEILPFAPYYLDHSLIPENVVSTDFDYAAYNFSQESTLSLEAMLLQKNVVQNPTKDAKNHLLELSNDQLEQRLWNAMEDYCIATKRNLSDHILCLLPRGRSWMHVADVWYRRVCSSRYPSHRRQRRLSFSASYLLESTSLGRDMRQVWLETPTTKARLADLVSRLEQLNEKYVGDFQ